MTLRNQEIEFLGLDKEFKFKYTKDQKKYEFNIQYMQYNE